MSPRACSTCCLWAPPCKRTGSGSHLVLVVPREGTPGGHARLIATLTEVFAVFVTKAELESFAGDWWLRRHQAGDSGYESATPPQVPEELELRPKILRPIPHAQNDQPWTLYCVQVRPVAAHVIQARASYRAQIEKKQQLEAKLEGIELAGLAGFM